MPAAEFEEKSFGEALSTQLLAGSSSIFAPGQVLEAAVGFDTAMETYNAQFWALWGGPPAGACPAPAWWPAKIPRPALPSFRLNLFLQYKRPYFLTMSNAGEWSHWCHPYFRFRIRRKQQRALVACAKGLGRQGLVVYACPAFSKSLELFEHIHKGALVENTNFTEVVGLRRHKKYTFAAPGKRGIALSEPTEIESLNIIDRVDSLVMEAQADATDVLEAADRAINSALASNSWIAGPPAELAMAVGRAAELAAEAGGNADAAPSVARFMRVSLFCMLLGLGWLVAAPAAPPVSQVG